MADFTIIDVHSLAPAMGVVSTDLLAVGQSDTNLHKLSLGELSNYLGTSGGLLEFNDLDGFLYDVQYNSTNHILTFYQQNAPNIVIDLPIEQLIKGVQLVGNDLIFTFEDGSTVTVPLNTLLVGVVKSVNGLTPNSQGEIILNVTDIPNLSSELANKLDIRMTGLVSNLTQPEKDAILTKLGVVNNVIQVLGLSGNTITLSNGGGSISLNIANIGGLQTVLDLKADISQIPTNYITTNTTQTGLSGDKTTSGSWTYMPSIDTSFPTTGMQGATKIGKTISGSAVVGYDDVGDVAYQLRGYASSSVQLNLLKGMVSSLGYVISGRTNSDMLLAGGGHRPVSDFALASAIPTVNNGQLTLSTGNGLSGLATFTANQSGSSTFTVGIASTHKLPTTVEVSNWDDAYLLRHSHSNKGVLDNLTQSVIDNSHTHSNKVVLDSISAGDVISWNDAVSLSHSHANKALLDTYNQTNADITDAVDLSHSHTNKTILDAITAAFTTAEKDKIADIEPNAQVNVNADWNATSGDAEILNKPVIPAQLVYTGSNGINVTGTVISPTYGTTSNTIAQGNDSRINNGQTAFGWGNHSLMNYWRSNYIRSNYFGTVTDLDSTLPQGGFISSYNAPAWGGSDRPNGASFGGYIKFSEYTDGNNLDFYYNNGHNNTPSRLWYRTKHNSGITNWVELYHTGNFNPAQYVLQSALNTQLANYVPINGVTTINNTKTFTSSPVVPNGTLNGHAVNLGQLNTILGDYATETWVTQQISNISIPTVNDGQLSIATGTGLSGSVNFTANQAGNSSVTIDVASTHKLPTITEWNALPTNDTITRLRGTTSGTFTSGDLTLLEGTGIGVTQSGANFTITNSSPNVQANNGLLTISTSADLTGGGTFSADQATASNVNIGLSSGTLSRLDLADTALQSGDNVSELNNDVGYLTSFTETDPIFTASPAYGISLVDITNWNSKTSNTGTVTSIIAGTGLSGGTITTSGTIALNSATLTSLGLANTALQSGDDISELNNDVGYITSSSLPTNYITTNTNQTGLSGDKTTSGSWTYMPTSVTSFPSSGMPNATIIGRSTFGSGTVGYDDVGDTAYRLRGYQSSGIQLDLLKGNVSSLGYNISGRTNSDIVLAGGGHRPVSDFALAGSLGNYVPTSRTITINGVAQNLSANRTWTIPDNDTITRLRGTTSGTYTSGDLTLLEGAGIGVSQSGSNFTITNLEPNIIQTLSQSGQTITLSNGGGSVTIPFTDWADIPNKPSSFPPSAHTHPINQVTGLQNALDDKADTDGGNATGGLATTIANSHTHSNKAVLDGITAGDITNWDNKFTLPSGGSAGQYVNGLGNLATLPTIPTVNDGSFTVQGTGALTGTGSTSANASADTTATLDLTQTTKNDIQEGVNANAEIPALKEGVGFHHVTSASNYTVTITNKKTIVNVADGVLDAELDINDAPYIGYELAINGCQEWSAYLNGNIQNRCLEIGRFYNGATSMLFWWDGDMWVQAI